MGEPVFICGAAKAGTNAVFEALRATDGFVAPRIKEPGFFSPDIEGSQKVSTWEHYRALYAGAAGSAGSSGGTGSRPLDGSVSYLLSEVAAAGILERFPQARFVVCLRRQAEMARSFHGQLRRNATESIPSFEAAWNAQADRAAGRRIPTTMAEPRLLQYRWVCSVGRQVQRLLDVVPRSQVLFIEHERLTGDPSAVGRELANHLRVPAPSIPPLVRTNEARQWLIDPYPLLGRLPRPLLETVRGAKRAMDRHGYPPSRAFRFGLRPTPPTGPTGPGGPTDDRFLSSLQASFAADTDLLRSATGLQLADW